VGVVVKKVKKNSPFQRWKMVKANGFDEGLGIEDDGFKI
jgi:hypothetical protein